MKKLTLMVEGEFIDILQDFKKNIKGEKISDEKAMILITRYFMEKFNKEKEKNKLLNK